MGLTFPMHLFSLARSYVRRVAHCIAQTNLKYWQHRSRVSSGASKMPRPIKQVGLLAEKQVPLSITMHPTCFSGGGTPEVNSLSLYSVKRLTSVWLFSYVLALLQLQHADRRCCSACFYNDLSQMAYFFFSWFLFLFSFSFRSSLL